MGQYLNDSAREAGFDGAMDAVEQDAGYWFVSLLASANEHDRENPDLWAKFWAVYSPGPEVRAATLSEGLYPFDTAAAQARMLTAFIRFDPNAPIADPTPAVMPPPLLATDFPITPVSTKKRWWLLWLA